MKKTKKRIVLMLAACMTLIGGIQMMPERVEAAVVTAIDRNHIVCYQGRESINVSSITYDGNTVESPDLSGGSIPALKNDLSCSWINKEGARIVVEGTVGGTYDRNSFTASMRIKSVNSSADAAANKYYYSSDGWLASTVVLELDTSSVRNQTVAAAFEKVNATLGRHASNRKVAPATCTTGGYTTYECRECGTVSPQFDLTNATGHSWGKTSYDWETYPGQCAAVNECLKCNLRQSETVETVAKILKVPTCTKAGEAEYIAIFTKEGLDPISIKGTLPATGHSYGKPVYAWSADHTKCTGSRKCTASGCTSTLTAQATVTSVITKQPTCMAEGVKIFTAKFSDANYTAQTAAETMEKQAHQYEEKVVKPTCTADGYTILTCKWCGTEHKGDIEKASGHKEGGWIVDRQATTSEAGMRHKECIICGTVTVSEEIPKIVEKPTDLPTEKPTETTTEKPMETPTEEPTETTTEKPTETPTEEPTEHPTETTTEKPTETPTEKPTEHPTETTTEKPTETPTEKPTEHPTEKPTEHPTEKPTEHSTKEPTGTSTEKPSETPVKKTTEVSNNMQKKIFTVKDMKYRVTTQNKVTVIGAGNKTIKTLTIPVTVRVDGKEYTVTAIGQKAFKNYKNLTKVIVGSKVVTIGDEAFFGCKKLTKVIIGAGVKEIGAKVFYQDKKLKAVTIKSSKLKSVGKQTFKGVNKKVHMKVPKKKINAYKKIFKSETGYVNTMKIDAVK